ncbi:hypothetical protein TIFTF001_000089 [Ficus carica]|uniref:Uncharacterized protein n=1 Tax=Ficus carica TaxID=3494 RepID=A0AA88CNE7_FICCA|nr:hypothetical protein TIFTF001_000089 [Ficus carica]
MEAGAGAGAGTTDFNTVFTFADYNELLTNFMSSLPSSQKVIVVGQSARGLSVTDVIHKFAEKINLAVYVAADMLKHGYGNISNDEHIYEDVSGMPNFGSERSTGTTRI